MHIVRSIAVCIALTAAGCGGLAYGSYYGYGSYDYYGSGVASTYRPVYPDHYGYSTPFGPCPDRYACSGPYFGYGWRSPRDIPG